MSIFFRVLSAAYIAGIFLLADSPIVSDVAPLNPYSLLHIPLYGILTLLLVLSFSPRRGKCVKPTNSNNPTNSMNPSNPSNPTNPTNLLLSGLIALAVGIADEIYQAYLPTRDASVIDVLLDLVGIIFCILLMRRFQSQSGFSRVKDFLRGITYKKAIFY
jgi:hypothetical protein